MAKVTKKEREVKVVQEESYILELTPEEAKNLLTAAGKFTGDFDSIYSGLKAHGLIATKLVGVNKYSGVGQPDTDFLSLSLVTRPGL